MIGGSLDHDNKVVSWYVRRTGVPFLSVGYRLAPEATSSTGLAEDVFTALKWLTGHAADFEVDPARIAVMGDSGGGGPVAGAAILARDRNVPLAKHILVPMLDLVEVVYQAFQPTHASLWLPGPGPHATVPALTRIGTDQPDR